MGAKIFDRNPKKTEIVQAALQVFSRKGFANTKIADIASLAHVGKGTIYEYFRSKAEIFGAAYTLMSETMNAHLMQKLSQISHPAQKLKVLFDFSLDYFGHDALDFSAIMLQFWAEGIRTMDKDVAAVIDLKQIYSEYRTQIVGIIEEGQQMGAFRNIDAVAYASLAIAALDGLLLQLVTDPEIIDLQTIKHVFSNTMLAAIVIDGTVL